MDFEFKDFGFYLIDEPYLKYLHEIDEEVRYDEYKDYERKPFVGILVQVRGYTYFIPLTSAKQKRASWNNVDKTYYLIYEIIDQKNKRTNDVVKPYSDTQYLKIFAALDIKKMVPVPDGLYKKKDFNAETDLKYRALLQKEYRFCLKIKDGILEKAKTIYSQQKTTQKVLRFHCDFAKLEKACDEYQAPEKK